MISSLLLTCIALADPFGEAMDRAAELESAGDPAAAVEVLAPWLTTYRQDYALAIRLGWLAFQAEDWSQAEEAYKRAVELSDGSLDAQLGLAWTWVRTGELAGARSLADRLAKSYPHEERVAALLSALSVPSLSLRTGITGIVVALAPHHNVDLGVGARVQLDGVTENLSGGLAVEAISYVLNGDASPEVGPTSSLRGESFRAGQGGPSDGGQPNGGGDARPWEDGAPAGGPWGANATTPGTDLSIWTHGGGGNADLGVELVGAALLQTAPQSQMGWVFGALGRARAAGDLRAELSCTQPRSVDALVWRVAPSWFAPVGRFAIHPGMGLQWAEGNVLPSGSLTLWALPNHWGLWAGGTVGPEWYRTSLALATTSAWPDLVRGGAWAGLRLGDLDTAWVSVNWSADWLDPDGRGSTPAAPAHGFTLGTNFPL